MKYYSYNITTKLPKTMKDALERVFTEDYWGVGQFNECVTPMFEICKVEGDVNRSIWTHFAFVEQLDNSNWVVYENHIPIDENFVKQWGEEYRMWIGTEQTAQYIYGYYKTFSNALRNLRKFGASNEHRKPIEVYV